MASENNEDQGPRVQFDWNFPLFRLISSKANSLSSSNRPKPGRKVASKVKSISSKVTDDDSQEVKSEEGSDDDSGELKDIKDRLNRIKPDDSPLVSNEDTDSKVTSYSGDVFIPTRTNLETGDELSIENESDEDITVIFSNGESLDIESGEMESTTFNNRSTVNFRIEGVDEESVCGGIIVGDVDEELDLPCESDTERETFASSSPNITVPDSMSVAAEKKKDSDKGW